MDQRYLLFYDISSPRVYRRITKELDKYLNIRIQKSVYEMILDPLEYKAFKSKMIRLCDGSCDRIALIPLSLADYSKVRHYGKNVDILRSIGDSIIV